MIIGNPITLGGGGAQYVWNKYSTELADGYTAVEYIESTSTQYINTGFYPKGNTRVVADFDITGGETYPTAFGTWTSEGTAHFAALWFNNSTFRSFYDTTYYDAGINLFGRRLIEMDKGAVRINNTEVVSATTGEFTSANPLYLFNFGSLESRGVYQIYAKCYFCKIYDGDTLVRNLAPCVNAENEAGMYDTVNGVFYPNVGSGTFIVGGVGKGTLLGQVKSSDINAYPVGGMQDGYYYEAVGDTLNVTENGSYDVRPYVTANVNVQSAPVLLWTNARPNSSFAEQTVTVTSGYDAYLVETKYSTSNAVVSTLYLGASPTHFIIDVSVGQSSQRAMRYLDRTGNSFNFGSGQLSGGLASNQYAIPTRIWGVKFTL